MILNEHQIDRYSRQIIVPRVGGRAQERLLDASVTIVAEARDTEMAVAYLAGAGVGRTRIHPVDDPALYQRIAEQVRDLNPEAVATVENGARSSDVNVSAAPDLVLALIGSAHAAKVAESLCRTHRATASVIARLDTRALVAVLPTPPPCALCAAADLWGSPSERGTNDGVVAMLAAVEAFKLLAGFDEHPRPRLFEFAGYSATPRVPGRRSDTVRCRCEAR